MSIATAINSTAGTSTTATAGTSTTRNRAVVSMRRRPAQPSRRVGLGVSTDAPNPAAVRRRSRAISVGAATIATSAAYLAGSAAGVDFTLTDPSAAQSVHLVLAEIIFFTLGFGLLGWAALAAVERFTVRPRAVWSALAASVLLLSFVPIGVEHATTGTKVTLVIIHTTVAVALFPMLRRSSARRRSS